MAIIRRLFGMILAIPIMFTVEVYILLRWIFTGNIDHVAKTLDDATDLFGKIIGFKKRE